MFKNASQIFTGINSDHSGGCSDGISHGSRIVCCSFSMYINLHFISSFKACSLVTLFKSRIRRVVKGGGQGSFHLSGGYFFVLSEKKSEDKALMLYQYKIMFCYPDIFKYNLFSLERTS